MLGGVKLAVNLAREQTCFAYINSKYSSNSEDSQCIQVLVGDSHVYLWAVFLSSVPEGQILLHSLHCKLLGLVVGQEVYVTSANPVRPIDSLYIEADGNEDQVILEHNQIQLQSVFLNQVRLVAVNQKAVVWLSPSMPIVFTPQQTGILVNHSSVFVRMNVLDPTILTPKQEDKQELNKATKGLLKPYINSQRRLVLRALPIEGDGKKDLIHPYTVFMHEDLVEEKLKSSTLIVALMKSLLSSLPNKSDEDQNSWQQELCVEIVPVNGIIYKCLCREIYSKHIPTILIPKSLNRIINVENGTMILLTFIDSNKLRQPDHIEIVTYTSQNNQDSEMSLVDRFKSTVIETTYSGKVFLINHEMVKQNKKLTSGYIKFQLSPNGLVYTTLTQETFRNCTISARNLDLSEMKIPQPITSSDYDSKSYCRTIKLMELLLEKIISHIYFDIHREAQYSKCSDLKSNVLITGLSGSGKSTLCYLVEKEMSVYTHILHCRPLKGRKDIPVVLGKALVMCSDRKPAVLVLDDMDALVPASLEGLSPQDVATYNSLAVDIKQTLHLCSGVSVLATSRGFADLHPAFRMSTGQPLFTAQFAMPELTQEDRVHLIEHLVTDKVRAQFDVSPDDVIRIAMDTNGCTIRDVTDYYNRKIFAAVKKKNANANGPKPRLVEDVTKDVEKAKSFDIWGPIGGMEDVKEKLNECIFWPIMYPALFPSQGCGILLYGPPGTGKSLIGSCLAKLNNMNMIIVKGPELLSKYIGQSEAAVREVFDKAEMKRPCILFFDEFDSLAPKRGHDSTGVTDRVVNQLLARLDGAEGGAHGPVIAATSRPDLVDRALLRTGRLQTHVYCATPTHEGRHSVLRTLAQEFHLQPDVDLGWLSARTAGYSPADLKALLVTAQLSRLDIELTKIQQSNSTKEPTLESVVISSEDIRNSLAETKPSLSPQQRAFYDIIYRRFRGEVPSNSVDRQNITDDIEHPRMRVTLA